MRRAAMSQTDPAHSVVSGHALTAAVEGAPTTLLVRLHDAMGNVRALGTESVQCVVKAPSGATVPCVVTRTDT
jgi:hypothetical protein